jgi:hypothetical protein
MAQQVWWKKESLQVKAVTYLQKQVEETDTVIQKEFTHNGRWEEKDL